MKRDPAKKRARILIVDDHPAVREALAMRISQQPDLEVCGEAADSSEALCLVADTEPDVAVVDISLKTGCGIDLIKRIKDRNDTVRMLVWSTHSESLYAERALRAGALGYINKDQATDKIVDGIRRRTGRQGLLERRDGPVDVAPHRRRGTRGSHAFAFDALADRELEVFRLIGQGVKTAEIAGRLHLSVKTIETYRDRIRAKLDLSDGTALAHYATKWMQENDSQG